MQFLLVGIFVLFSCCGKIAESSPLESLPFRSSGIHSGRSQQPQFAESIKNWFRDMKARIFPTPSTTPDTTSIRDSINDSYEQRNKFLNKLIVDMSKVAFDPEKDWGIRIGNWYLMRKDSDGVMSSFWKLIRPRTSTDESTTDDEWRDLEFNHDKTTISPSFNPFNHDKTTISPSFNTVIPIVPVTIEENISPSTESVGPNDHKTVDQSAE